MNEPCVLAQGLAKSHTATTSPPVAATGSCGTTSCVPSFDTVIDFGACDVNFNPSWAVIRNRVLSSKTADTTTHIASPSNSSGTVLGAPMANVKNVLRGYTVPMSGAMLTPPSSLKTTASSPITAIWFFADWSYTVSVDSAPKTLWPSIPCDAKIRTAAVSDRVARPDPVAMICRGPLPAMLNAIKSDAFEFSRTSWLTSKPSICSSPSENDAVATTFTFW